MKRLTVLVTFLAVAGSISVVQAQNLLVNGDLNATPAFTYYDGSNPSIADDVPGWILSLGAADGSYVQVAPEVDPLAGGFDADMGISPAGGGLETAPLVRPVVVPGLTYLASVTYDNYFGATGAAYFIDWFNIGGGLISSNGGALADLNGPFAYAPYTQLLSVLAVAPAGATTAGVRFRAGNPNYDGLAADNFSFSLVPEPGSATLIILALLSLANTTRRRR